MQTADLREVTAQYFSVQDMFKNQTADAHEAPEHGAGRTGFTSCLLTPNTTSTLRALGPLAGRRVRLRKRFCADGSQQLGVKSHSIRSPVL